jgi:hypothetical protein
MPPQQRLGLNEESGLTTSGEQPAESRQQCTIGGSHCRAPHLASKDRHLMSEYHNLDRQVGAVDPPETE